MARPPGQLHRLILHILADGQWRDREHIMANAMPSVPWRDAWRIHGEFLQRDRERKKYVRLMSDPRNKVRVGARRIVNSRLISMTQLGKVDRHGNHFRIRNTGLGGAP